MRVLFVAPELPHPPYTGAHTRPLSIMRALAAAGHEIIAVGALPGLSAGAAQPAAAQPDDDATASVGALPGDDATAAAGPDDLLHLLCAEVVAVPATDTRDSRRALLSRGRKLLSPVPLIGKGYNPTIADLVARTVARVRPQALHLQTMYAVHYAAVGTAAGAAKAARRSAEPAASWPATGATAVPAVLDLTDVVSGLCDTAAQARPLRYAGARLQAASSRRQEQHLLAGVLPMTINDDDRERLARLGIAAYTVPLAIELPDLHGALLAEGPVGAEAGDKGVASAEEGVASAEGATATSADAPVDLLFVGSMLHAPNREAARFLIEKLAPELRRRGLRFRLTIAGRAARPETIGLHRVAADQPVVARGCGTLRMQQINPAVEGTGIELHPDAPDLAPLYRRADIVLAPLPHGGGTKNKTLEAMAYARPVVGTPQAFTGLGPDARAAYTETSYDAAALAAAVAELAAHPLRRIRMARCGRQYVAARHSQELVNRRVRVLYDAIARGGGVAAAEAAWKDHTGQT